MDHLYHKLVLLGTFKLWWFRYGFVLVWLLFYVSLESSMLDKHLYLIFDLQIFLSVMVIVIMVLVILSHNLPMRWG